MKPEDAFEFVESIIEEALTATQESSIEAIQARNFNDVEAIVAHAQELQKLAQQFEEFQIQFWKFFEKDQEGTIETVEQNPTRTYTNQYPRLERHKATPRSAYYRPILMTLVENGGSGTAKEVTEKTFERMKHMFNSYDYELLEVDGSERWHKNLRWARYNLAQDGLLKSDSPRGIWEISDAGKRWLGLMS